MVNGWISKEDLPAELERVRKLGFVPAEEVDPGRFAPIQIELSEEDVDLILQLLYDEAKRCREYGDFELEEITENCERLAGQIEHVRKINE